jgi:uncharacterized protein (DUF2249 family)
MLRRPEPGTEPSGWVATPKPAGLAALPESRQVRLDVRDDIAHGREPFSRIMAAVGGLGADAVLVIRAPFEPVPLYAALGRRGFEHWTERHGSADWSVWFYRDPATPAPGVESGQPGTSGTDPGTMISLDVRGLEPPLPMARVLEGLETLAPGQRLEVLLDRRPMFLYPQLDGRGFSHETEDRRPGLVRVVIRRGSPP